MPPDENCIPLLQLLRANLSVAQPRHKRFPFSARSLVPNHVPRHRLVGLNHRALEDCHQTRLVCMAFDQLCKPIAERGEEWQPDGVANSAQTSILDWLQPTCKADDGKGKILALKDDDRSRNEQSLANESTPRSERKARSPSGWDPRNGSTLRNHISSFGSGGLCGRRRIAGRRRTRCVRIGNGERTFPGRWAICGTGTIRRGRLSSPSVGKTIAYGESLRSK